MRTKRSHRGLSLVEILVAAAIAAIVSAAMALTLSEGASRTARAGQDTSLSVDLRQAIDYVSNEAQQAVRLYKPGSGSGEFSTTVTGASGYQPIFAFFVPNFSTTDETDYLFRVLYLADPPESGLYRGPKVLYLARDTTVYTGTPTTPPTNPPASVAAGEVVSDNLLAQNTANGINAFRDDGTNAGSNSVRAGVLSLATTTTNMTGGTYGTTARTLTVSTRIAARN